MCQDRCHQEVNELEMGEHCEPAVLHRALASVTMLENLHPGKVWAVSTCSWVGLDAGSPVCGRGGHHHHHHCLGAVERSQGQASSWNEDPLPQN